MIKVNIKDEKILNVKEEMRIHESEDFFGIGESMKFFVYIIVTTIFYKYSSLQITQTQVWKIEWKIELSIMFNIHESNIV